MKEIFDLKMKKGDGGEISERRIQVSGYDACEMLEAFWHIWVFGCLGIEELLFSCCIVLS